MPNSENMTLHQERKYLTQNANLLNCENRLKTTLWDWVVKFLMLYAEYFTMAVVQSNSQLDTKLRQLV